MAFGVAAVPKSRNIGKLFRVSGVFPAEGAPSARDGVSVRVQGGPVPHPSRRVAWWRHSRQVRPSEGFRPRPCASSRWAQFPSPRTGGNGGSRSAIGRDRLTSAGRHQISQTALAPPPLVPLRHRSEHLGSEPADPARRPPTSPKGVQIFNSQPDIALVGAGSEECCDVGWCAEPGGGGVMWWPWASRSGQTSRFARLMVTPETLKSCPRRFTVASLRKWSTVARMRSAGVSLAFAPVPGATSRSCPRIARSVCSRCNSSSGVSAPINSTSWWWVIPVSSGLCSVRVGKGCGLFAGGWSAVPLLVSSGCRGWRV